MVSSATQVAAISIGLLDMLVLIFALCRPAKVQVKWYEILLALSGMLLILIPLP